MGNVCYNINREGLNLETGEIPISKLGALDFFRTNNQNTDEANPEAKPKQEKQKIRINQRIKQKLYSEANHLNYKNLVEQQYRRVKHSYEQHYIDQANQEAKQLEHLINTLNQKNLNYTLNEQQKALLQRVKMEYTDVTFFESQIQRGGWDLKSDKNGMKISCRREEDGTVGCRIEALSDVPFQILISIMIQVEFYKDYTPFLEVSRQEKEVARNCKIGYTLNHMPLFTKRESFFQGIGYSRLNSPKEQLFLFTRSIHDKKHIQDLLEFPVEVNPEYIQLDYKYFVVRYRPIKKNVGLIDIGMNVDAKISYVPTWLMEKVSKQFGEKFFKNIVRISKNFKGSKWQKNVEKNPHLFLYFQREVNSFLQKHNLN